MIETRTGPYTRKDGRKFGFTLGIAFLVLTAILLWRDHESVARVMGWIGGSLLALGLLVPTWLRPIEAGWMKFAEVLSKVTTPIFMGIIYFLIFTTFGFFRRRLGGGLENDLGGTAWAAHEGRSELTRQF